jgi:hypothetical protein
MRCSGPLIANSYGPSSGPADRQRDFGAAGRETHRRPRQAADGEDPARVFSQRADKGHPERDRRRGRPRRVCRDRGQDQEDQVLEGGGEKATHELKKLRHMSPMSRESTVVRNYLDGYCRSPGTRRPRSRGISRLPRRFSTTITSAWRRSRNASSNTSPSSSAPTS